MKGVRVYIEGGGDSGSQKALLRTGFAKFLAPLCDAARARRLTWDVILCGSRTNAYQDFQTALRTHPDSFNILLVDAEGPVAGQPWAHLAVRDGWTNPGVADERCHLMVQTVEAWLMADPEALANYYGQGFRPNLLPRNLNVEEIPKEDLAPALAQASEKTTKGAYRKINHCANLLKKVDVASVRRRAVHCDRLFNTVMGVLEWVAKKKYRRTCCRKRQRPKLGRWNVSA
jgi:hypothetical protein